MIKENDIVYYKGQETEIEELDEEGGAVIRNPYWNHKEETSCISKNERYEAYYWLLVELTELTTK
jgi:hypothetical protein